MTQPELRTERLVLRRFCKEDVSDALEYRNDADFVRFLPHIPHPFTRADAEQFVAVNMSEDWRRSPTFAVVLGGRLIGTVSLEVDHVSRGAMLGYAIGRQWWGRGFVVEAARAIIGWSISEFRLRRIWASTDARHARSKRVLERLGMARETIRADDHQGRDGTSVDEVVYGLRTEAPA